MQRLKEITTRDKLPGGFFYLSIFILFVSFGFVLMSLSIWDYDFWWHLATGRYIVDTGHLQASDPFSFTSQLPENNNLYPERERFILTQYWLAQVIFYEFYRFLGFTGIGVLRALILLLAVYLIYRDLKDRGAPPYVIYLSLFVAFVSLLKFMAERPVLYTILFTVVCFILLDSYIRKRSRAFYLMPVITLVWANLHGGFIIGDIIIIFYLSMEIIKSLIKRTTFSSKEKWIFFSTSLLSIALSGINPNSFFAFQIALSREYEPFYVGIQEYQSPFLLYMAKLATPDWGYLVSLAALPVVLLLRNKKFNPTHLVLLIFFAAASISACRFTVYYCLIAAIVLGSELSLWLKDHREKIVVKQEYLNWAFSLFMLVSSIFYLIGAADLKSLNIRESALTVPKGAADFIERRHLGGNMYNGFDNGGYLAWRLYPRVKTFIDTRALNYTVINEYAWMAAAFDTIQHASLPPGKIPLWKRLLEHYKIDFVVLNPFDVYGRVAQLIFRLLDDGDWVPVFSDVNAIIFVKQIPDNMKIIDEFRISKEKVLNMMILRATLSAQYNNQSPVFMESLGDLFEEMGNKDDAIKAYSYALKRLPDTVGVKKKLDKLMEEAPEVRK